MSPYITTIPQINNSIFFPATYSKESNGKQKKLLQQISNAHFMIVVQQILTDLTTITYWHLFSITVN